MAVLNNIFKRRVIHPALEDLETNKPKLSLFNDPNITINSSTKLNDIASTVGSPIDSASMQFARKAKAGETPNVTIAGVDYITSITPPAELDENLWNTIIVTYTIAGPLAYNIVAVTTEDNDPIIIEKLSALKSITTGETETLTCVIKL